MTKNIHQKIRDKDYSQRELIISMLSKYETLANNLDVEKVNIEEIIKDLKLIKSKENN